VYAPGATIATLLHSRLFLNCQRDPPIGYAVPDSLAFQVTRKPCHLPTLAGMGQELLDHVHWFALARSRWQSNAARGVWFPTMCEILNRR
jgi:hypothetical protein